MPHGDPDEHAEEEREEEERRLERKAEVLEQIQEVLEEHNYKISDIPIEPGGYWGLLNIYRGI